jgi:hypothetical protein
VMRVGEGAAAHDARGEQVTEQADAHKYYAKPNAATF